MHRAFRANGSSCRSAACIVVRKQAAAWEATIDTGGAPVSGGITVGKMTLEGRVYTVDATRGVV